MKNTGLLFLFLALLTADTRASQALAEQSVYLTDFKLTGDLAGDQAAFTLTAIAHVSDSRGDTLTLISGPLALTSFAAHPRENITAGPNEFSVTFDRRGDFPVQLEFGARVGQADGWKSVQFKVAPSVLRPVVLRGLAADTQVRFENAAPPERKDNEFLSYLPADGSVKFSWKEGRPEMEGKLFYSADMLAQISVSPGLMRQAALLNFKVMQGELTRIALRLRGAGEITRVQGDQVLAWNVERVTNSDERRLIIQLNQPQKDQFECQIQAQTPLDAFPQTTDILQLRPETATRFAGFLRLGTEGAVRLEVLHSSGASQISPDQFPDTDAAALRTGGIQRFAYRFAGTDFSFRIQADQILPEVGISQTLAYHVGESELAIDAGLELDVREAPLRELLLDVPKGYAVAGINGAGINDYFLTDTPEPGRAQLRVVYGQPISGRQLLQLRLEHNQGMGDTNWDLPRVEAPQAKTVRGFIGVAADAGLRLTSGRNEGLTEIATAYYPEKLDGIQTAFRLNDNSWKLALRVERLPQTVQANAVHLFSIGEGIAFGSSIINYVVSGAPLSTFRVELSGEYTNVEFTGKDLRGWRETNGGFLVQLHTPVSGAYTLLATYERPFKPQGETLSFTGARPLDAQSEEGYTLLTSANQFEIKNVDVSRGLLPLEPGEVPAEDRLFFDAPILAAYRYGARPFDLKLALSPLAQGDSLNQIVDRASFDTRVSKEGQVLTSARYFIKNRGNPHFRLTLPEGAQLWSATVDGAAVVPVQDGKANLIPLPQRSDPNAVLDLAVQIATQLPDARNIHLSAPAVEAPILLSEWKFQPDAGQRLVYQSGSVRPAADGPDISGFGQLARLFTGPESGRACTWIFSVLALAAISILVWQRACVVGVQRSGAAAVLVFIVLIGVCLTELAAMTRGFVAYPLASFTLLAPVQQPGAALTVTASNVPDKIPLSTVLMAGWPVLAGLLLLAAARKVGWALRIFGWLLLAWGTLRIPNEAMAFCAMLFAFFAWRIVRPVVRWLRSQPRPQTIPGGAAPTAVAGLLAGLFLFSGSEVKAEAALPESVNQTVRVTEKFAAGTAKIHWKAVRGDVLPVLAERAILTHIVFPLRSLKLEATEGEACPQRLVAEANGTYDIEIEYQTPVSSVQTQTAFTSPVPFGLVNHLAVTVVNMDVDVSSPQAVSIHADHSTSNTVASLVLSPATVFVAWQPRHRDARQEKPIFYAETTQLYAPLAGVIEGAHQISVRIAQGELAELILDAPHGATVTDVAGPAVSLWRFDPDSGKVRVTLNPPQSRPFSLTLRSQITAGPLPFEQSVGFVSVEGSAGEQIGLAGIATGAEVQLDSVTPGGLSPINLEDFPGDILGELQKEFSDLTVRRAFRYAGTNASLGLRVAAVQPDVRAQTEDTLSLGEDRTVLADNLSVTISRAGIFDFSFKIPDGFDVESISGPALSQWTDLKTDAGRIITLHLTGKILGTQTFALTLIGPGLKTARNWKVPQVVVREADKESGSLLVVPEQGMRLQVASRDGYLQLDPQKEGIKEKGVLGFRALQTPSSLTLDIEQVDPWIQVTSLQHVALNEDQVKVTANLDYQIENTGLKALRILIDTNAEGVRFDGDQVGDFSAASAPAVNGFRAWEVKLRRRVIGQYLLQVSYQIVLPANARRTTLLGVQAGEVNLQHGYLTIQSDPRLQLTIDPLPEALQTTEWQSIPRNLQKDLQTAAADFSYRVTEPSFALPVQLERHEAAKLLPAKVNNITFQSVVADDGSMLTRTRVELLPGDKRLLAVKLPADARFWFAFVNDTGAWPWRDGDKILIPLERSCGGGKAVTVEFFHSCRAGTGTARALDLDLLAPKLDLPLENITWKISLGDKWRVKNWSGALQLQKEEKSAPLLAEDANAYLQTENSLQETRTAEAQQYMALGNSSLEKGDSQQARRAFAAAMDLSTHDAAFNEDARVQLHNIKLQQALIGLNANQSGAEGDPGALGGKLRELRNQKAMNYTQQDAKDIIDINTAEENATFMKLAEKLIHQEDAAVSNPAGIRASVPEQGRVVILSRAVAVEPWADLSGRLQATSVPSSLHFARLYLLLAAGIVFAGFLFATRNSNPAAI